MTDEQSTPKRTAPGVMTTANDSRKSYMYVGTRESGEMDFFSDELEASRYALEGAKAKVEKKELRKRSK